MTKPDPEALDGDLPELGDDFFERARPAAEVMGDAFMARARRGRPRAARPKVAVTIRLDALVVQHLRATGKGWQTRVNDEVAALIAKGRL